MTFNGRRWKSLRCERHRCSTTKGAEIQQCDLTFNIGQLQTIKKKTVKQNQIEEEQRKNAEIGVNGFPGG